MKLSELQKKDIINIKDGKKIGKIIDAEFDINNGQIKYFLIERTSYIKNIFSSNEELNIQYSQIKKLGEDVILIDI